MKTQLYHFTFSPVSRNFSLELVTDTLVQHSVVGLLIYSDVINTSYAIDSDFNSNTYSGFIELNENNYSKVLEHIFTIIQELYNSKKFYIIFNL